MMRPDERRSLMTLVGDVITDVTELFQTEIRLIRAEISDNASRFASNAAMLAAGSIAGMAALFLLLLGMVAWLAEAGLPERWGYLIVGVIVAGLAAGLLAGAIKGLKSQRLVPERSMEQLKADLATLKERV
jgi:hypothetical protein